MGDLPAAVWALLVGWQFHYLPTLVVQKLILLRE